MHDQVHGTQHVGQHVVGFNLQVIRLEFNGYVPIAQMVGGADQVVRRSMLAAMCDAQHRLWCSDDAHQRTVVEHQHVATTYHGAPRKKNADAATA